MKKSSTKRADRTELVKKKILDTAVKIWPDISTRDIANKCGMTHANIVYHFGDSLYDAIVSHAIKNNVSRVIAHLILQKDPAVKHMKSEERQKHLSAMARF